MKKLVALSIVFVLAVSAVFADVSVGGGGEADWYPLSVTIPGDGSAATVNAKGPAAWPPDTYIYAAAHGDWETFGFNLQVETGGGTPAFGNTNLWWKPVTGLTLQFGKQDVSHPWGPGPVGGFGGVPGADGWGDIFASFAGGFNTLYIGYDLPFVPGLFAGIRLPGTTGAGLEFQDYYETIQIAVAYTIEGIGKVRLQYNGAKQNYTAPTAFSATDWGSVTSPYIQAAFDLTAVPLFTAFGVGVRIPFALNKNNNLPGTAPSWQDPIHIVLRADIGITPEFVINTGFTTDIGKTYKSDDTNSLSLPFRFKVSVTPNYKLSFATLGLDLGLDIGSEVKGEGAWESYSQKGNTTFGFALWASFPIGASSIKTGVSANFVANGVTEKTDTTIQVPVVASFWF